MAKDLGEGWRSVTLSESNPSLKPKNGRKSGWNEEQIIEVLVEKRPRAERGDQPAIDGIEQTSRQAERIKQVTEWPHRSAVITKPAPVANSNFRQNAIME
jgi:hypothetical protein